MKNKFLDPLMADLGLIKEAAGNPDEVSGLVDALREGSITVDDLSEEQLDAIGATLDAADASEEKQAAEAAQYVQAMGEEIGKVAYQEFRKIAAMETVTPEVRARAAELLAANGIDPASVLGETAEEKQAADELNSYVDQAALELLTNLGYERQE